MNYNFNSQRSLELAVAELQNRTRELETQVSELKAHNQAVKASRADETLKADVNAARGIAPGKGDVASLIEMRKFVQDILDPEMYGYAVSREVRNAARRVLGIDAKE